MDGVLGLSTNHAFQRSFAPHFLSQLRFGLVKMWGKCASLIVKIPMQSHEARVRTINVTCELAQFSILRTGMPYLSPRPVRATLSLCTTADLLGLTLFILVESTKYCFSDQMLQLCFFHFTMPKNVLYS